MSQLSQIDREFLRRQTLKFMAERFRVLLTVPSIATMMKARNYVDFEFAESDVEQTLAILTGKGLVEQTQDQFGATAYYQATANGIIESERI